MATNFHPSVSKLHEDGDRRDTRPAVRAFFAVWAYARRLPFSGKTRIWCLTAGRGRAKRRLTMTMKRWVLWLCVAALLATEVFLFLAKNQKDVALVQLHEARQLAVQLRAQLDQLKNSSVATLSAENARLRAENQNLTQKYARLQKDNNQLRKGNQQLTQQLQTTSDAGQQQQQMPAEDQQPVAASEPATDQSAAVAAQINTCINNLRLIEAAKQQWALDNGKTDDDIPNALELLPYFQNDVFPTCPAGGTYTINAVGVLPTCSVPGHVLPQ